MSFKIPIGNKISFDVETTGLFWRKKDRPYCFSFCNTEGDTSVISFPVNPKTREVQYQEKPKSFAILKEFFINPAITKIAHNAQFDVGMSKSCGLIVKGTIIDTMNLIRVVRSDAPLALKKFCSNYLGIGDDDEKELKDATRRARREGRIKGYAIYHGDNTEDGSLAPDYWLAPRSLLERYAITDAARCMAIYVTLLPEIKKEGLEQVWDQEQQTWKILRKIEKRGIRVFPEKINQTITELKKKQKTFQLEAMKWCPPKTNLNSSLQLRKIFYKQLKELPKYSTKAGYPSTDVFALKSFKHPLAKTILSIRACTKTIEFMDQYNKFMVQHKDGCYYIHPIIHQAMTVTGRESCSSPNLQQVGSGRNDKGIEILVEARGVFGPRPNYQMRSYDWSGQEVWIPAFASQDPVLVKMLTNGEDPHQHTSNELSKIAGEKIGRDAAKRTFFGLQYGIGTEKLAKTLGLEKNLAELIRHGFKKTYPRLNEWMSELQYEALTKGFIRTRYGRILYILQKESYKATNYFVQGTAGGILRSAKIKIQKILKKIEYDAHMVLPIHDEILVEVNTDFITTFDSYIVNAMQDNPELEMPLAIPVTISKITDNWADKKKVKTV